MKKKNLFAVGCAAILMAGCSSDDITLGEGEGGGAGSNGTSYVGLSITLPSTAGNRANSFDQGTANEYKVNSLDILYVDENNTIIEAKKYSADDLNWLTPPAGQDITTKTVLPVEKVNFAGKAKALVIINMPEAWNNSYAAKGTLKLDEVLKGFDNAEALTGKEKNAFVMTNAVHSLTGEALVDVTSYTTENEAQVNASKQNIYVERAAAKVTLKTNSWKNDTYTIAEGKSNAGATIKIDGWKLDVTNRLMYAVRHFGGYKVYNYDKVTEYCRFYGADLGHSYRNYWAEDPNYSDNDKKTETTAAETESGVAVQGDFNVIKDASKINNSVGDEEYCLENTFNVAHQKQDETTRVLIKATYTPFAPAETTITAEESTSGSVQNKFKTGDTWYTLGNSSTPLTADDVVARINKVLKANPATSTDGTAANAESSENNTVTLNEEAIKAGKNDITKDMVKIGESGQLTDNQLAAVQADLGKITAYVNGVCFYVVRIKHLADACPWGNEQNAPKVGGTEYADYVQGYSGNTSDYNKYYLGRYGVVRNNWYNVQLNTVTQPGEPTIPELKTNMDDEHANYIQTTINILDWAVRNQGVDL